MAENFSEDAQHLAALNCLDRCVTNHFTWQETYRTFWKTTWDELERENNL